MLTDTDKIILQMLLSKGANTIDTEKEKVLSRREMINNIVRSDIDKARAKSWIKKNLKKKFQKVL